MLVDPSEPRRRPAGVPAGHAELQALVHRGRLERDEFDVPDPPPLTTIGWLLVHVASCKVMYDEAAFGPNRLTFDDLVVPTAAQAIGLLEEG